MKHYNEYDNLGVKFIYPRNWFVQAETLDKGTFRISVDCPDGSFWALSIFPMDVDLDAEAKRLVGMFRAEYDEIERSEIKRYVADFELTGYEINFFFLDMTSSAQALKFQDGKRQYVVCTQTSDRLSIAGETLSKTDIFDVMTHTLVSNLTGQDADLWDGVEEDEPEIEDPKERRDAEYRDYIRRKYETRQREEENRRMRFASGAFVDHEDADGVDVGAALKAAFAGADADIADFLRTDEDYGEEYVDDSVEDPAWDEENPWERPKIDEDDDENENEKKED